MVTDDTPVFEIRFRPAKFLRKHLLKMGRVAVDDTAETAAAAYFRLLDHCAKDNQTLRQFTFNEWCLLLDVARAGYPVKLDVPNPPPLLLIDPKREPARYYRPIIEQYALDKKWDVDKIHLLYLLNNLTALERELIDVRMDYALYLDSEYSVEDSELVRQAFKF